MPNKLTIDDFLVRAKIKHGDKYDYSNVEYINSKTKVCIICKIHGEFKQIPSTHLNGHGCKKCGILINSYKCRSNSDDFIKKSQKLHGDKYDYSKVEYINSNTKVSIICKVHGEFRQTPNSHLNGHGCKTCGILILHDKLRRDTDEFIKKSQKLHGDKYDYSKVEYKGAKTKVSIICKIHGEFKQIANDHLNDHGCSKCSKTYKYTTTEWIEQAQRIHGDKYDYSKVEYKNANKKVSIICKIHGEFKQTPLNHFNHGHGCKKCGILITSDKCRSNSDDFIKKSQKLHGDKYDYSKVEYKGAMTKVCIFCNIHGYFYQKPNSHLNGYGCNKCGIDNIKKQLTLTTDDFIKKSQKLHGDKYDYSKVNYIESKTKVSIICKIHGEFYQTPSDHLYGCGCPKCGKKSYSKSQINWLDFMSKIHGINIQHAENDGEYQIPNSRYKADGFCEETNTIYEFHGDYWHGNPNLYDPNYETYFGKTCGELYEKTLKKEAFIREKNYNLIVMWEYDWNHIQRNIKKLQSKFKSYKKDQKL